MESYLKMAAWKKRSLKTNNGDDMKRLICLAAVAATCGVALDAAELRPAEQSRLPIGAVRPEGWLRVQLEKQRDGITGNAEKLYDDIGQSDWLTGEKRGGQYAWERGP